MIDWISKAVITGGAGFIGSRLACRLAGLGVRVVIADNFSSGSMENFRGMDQDRLAFVKTDCKDDPMEFVKGTDIIFHLAGNPEVRVGSADTTVDFNENVLATYRVLESARKHGVPNFAFTSTSTVYGEALTIPTPEDYSPLLPISTYGGSKLACEALISSFAFMFSIRSTIYRFANVVGAPSRHGVVFDFVRKLSIDPRHLVILGDGTQRKSYIDVEDCVDGMLSALDRDPSARLDVFNLGSSDTIDVLSIARIVSREMGLDPELVVTGGVDGGRGWQGDVKTMQLDISKISRLGWRPRLSSAASVERAARSLIDKELGAPAQGQDMPSQVKKLLVEPR